MVTTHVHRPLEQYISVFRQSGFQITQLKELTAKGFGLPRFLAVKCQKRNSKVRAFTYLVSE